MTRSGDLILRLLAEASSGPSPDRGVTGLCRHAEQEGTYWFLGGDGATALLYDAVEDTVVRPAGSIGWHWPPLLGTAAARRTDACYTTYHRPNGYHWFFAGDQVLQYDSVKGVVLQGPCPVGDLFRFTGEAADFARGVDAVCPPAPRDGLFWFFRGDRALQYDTREGRVTEPVRPLTAYWPGLAGTVFANGIDGCHTTHHLPGGRHWLFAGGLTGLYDSVRHAFVYGPAAFTELFPALREDLVSPHAGSAISR